MYERTTKLIGKRIHIQLERKWESSYIFDTILSHIIFAGLFFELILKKNVTNTHTSNIQLDREIDR